MTNPNDSINSFILKKAHLNEETGSLAISENMEVGLTKREYFAAMAMQGLIANAPNGHLSNSKEGVQLATDWADALINALNQQK